MLFASMYIGSWSATPATTAKKPIQKAPLLLKIIFPFKRNSLSDFISILIYFVNLLPESKLCLSPDIIFLEIAKLRKKMVTTPNQLTIDAICINQTTGFDLDWP